MVTIMIVLQHLNECVLQMQTKQVSSFYRTGNRVPLWRHPCFPSHLETSHKQYLEWLSLWMAIAVKRSSPETELLGQILLQRWYGWGLLWLEVWRRESLSHWYHSCRKNTLIKNDLLSWTWIATFIKLSPLLFWRTYTFGRIITHICHDAWYTLCLASIILLTK